MEPVIGEFPFPFHEAAGRELHVVLCQLYPSAKAAVFVAQSAGIDPAFINSDQAPYLVWKDILELGAKSGKNRKLLERVRDQLDNESPRWSFVEALLNAETPVLDSEPRGHLGAPRFVNGNDNVTENEALLYHDDLTLPIGRVPWLIDVLTKLKDLASAVCKLEVSRDALTQNGTGFRVAPDLVLTNWHVVHVLGAPATKIAAEFGFEDDGKGGTTASKAFAGDSIQSNKDDDWAIVRIAELLPDTIPTLKLSNAAEPAVGEAAFIVQHPGGARKRLAYARNQVTSFDNRVLQYLSDTQGGSSGSPVLNAAGRLIGLHHAGGRPQEVAGKPPLVKNEGIRIPAILKGLAKVGVLVS